MHPDDHHILFHLSVSSSQDCISLVTQVQSISRRRTTTSQRSGASRPNPTSPSPRWRSTVCSCWGWRCFITWTTALTSLSTSSSQDGFSATETLSEQDGSDFMCPESGPKTRACTSAGWPLDLAGRSHSSHLTSLVSRDQCHVEQFKVIWSIKTYIAQLTHTLLMLFTEATVTSKPLIPEPEPKPKPKPESRGRIGLFVGLGLAAAAAAGLTVCHWTSSCCSTWSETSRTQKPNSCSKASSQMHIFFILVKLDDLRRRRFMSTCCWLVRHFYIGWFWNTFTALNDL